MQFSVRISIGNEQFFGCEDSICRPILNDISVTFTILMQYLGLINRDLFFYILLTINKKVIRLNLIEEENTKLQIAGKQP